jgi:hypothetical protein
MLAATWMYSRASSDGTLRFVLALPITVLQFMVPTANVSLTSETVASFLAPGTGGILPKLRAPGVQLRISWPCPSF